MITLLVLLLAACDPYDQVARTDTIEAWEAYLADAPSGTNAFRAQIRLEELILERARAERTLSGWDAYLDRFPQGNHREAALKEREEALFDHARWLSTPESWQQFLQEYPKPGKGRRKEAEAGLRAATYAASSLKVGDVALDEVNLAEDPEGPLDGKRFRAEFTNTGDKAIETLWVRIHYLGADGRSLGERKWPLVAPYRVFPVPVEEALTVPMAPGDTRTWEWSTGDLPDGFAGKVRLVPFELRFVGDP